MKNRVNFRALSRRRAALGFALRVRAWLRLVKPCAQACCVPPSMLKKSCAHKHFLSFAKLSMSRHNVGMCGSLVRHANLCFTRVWCFLIASVHLVEVLLAAEVLRAKNNKTYVK